ncbi:MAG: acyl-CoA synthetase [Chitinophagaceae bacterium]
MINREKIAVIEGENKWTFNQLDESSKEICFTILQINNQVQGKCIAYMVDPGFDYVSVQKSIWLSGAIAVPLCLSHPLPSLQYVIEDTAAKIIIISSQYESLLSDYCRQHQIHLMVLEQNIKSSPSPLPELSDEDPAMILYTSGTTNKPKGVVLSHGNLKAQMETLIHAWKWSNQDHTLCVLPLHHVHGIVNVVGCANRIGAICEFLPNFSAEKVFELFLKGEINVFMAVPTIYFKLIAFWETLSKERQDELYNAMSKFRLMVCGSAALPVSIMEKWKLISGHILLERYGMTEIGMGISNPYNGERRAGFVGKPLPGVSVRVVDETYNDIVNEEPGEILIKGANVFKSYWHKPDETAKAFTLDGWFKTGDMCVIENEYYKIIGRSSVDIIKSGGYKISALEIEEVLRTHELVKDCAVVALPDEEWGEKIVVAIVGIKPEEDSVLTKWIRTQLPNYKCPKLYIWVDDLPRNAMGKVVKTEVKKLFN